MVGRRRFMMERRPLETKLVAIQLTTDEGAFICNIDEVDVPKIAARESGIFIVIHHAIRLDAMFEGQYEIHKTKMVEASSIDFYQSFHKKARYARRKA
jgi:hypothetical protein